MTDFVDRAIIVAPAARRAATRLAAKVLDPGADGAFFAELSPSGAAPATHYWCSWQMTPAQRARLQTELATLLGLGVQIFWLDSYDPAVARPTPSEVLVQTGLKVIVPPVV